MPNATQTKSSNGKSAAEQPAEKVEQPKVISSLPAATDEYKAVQALSSAGWPGRSASETLEAARKVLTAPSRLAQSAADDDLAKIAAKAAGSTGLASHDRVRVASLLADTNDIAQAAAQAAPTRDGAARALVWYVAALTAAEKEAAK